MSGGVSFSGYALLGMIVDTLIGFWLPAWRKLAKVEEVTSPKFYLFDPGVVLALAGRLLVSLWKERGFLLETWILHELRVARACVAVTIC